LQPISYKRHRFPAEVIRHAVWLYFRFTLSLRDVEELLAQRGIEVSYETIRCWTIKFGPLIAKNLRRRQPRPTGRWHIDEMVVKIGGERRWLWRAVDDEGVVLDMLVQRRRNKKAALRLLGKLLKNTGVAPETITTTSWPPTAPPCVIWILATDTDVAADDRTTGLRAATCRSDDGSGRCRSSRATAQPSASCPPTPRSTTPSTPSLT
jgi:transposase-like protein